MLPGENFSQVFCNALSMISRARGGEKCRWVGFNENWAVEFFSLLAQEFHAARFIIFIRNPRAAIASALRADEPTQIPLVLSFLRNWRKYIAFTTYFSEMPLFRDRLLVATYEDLVQQPEESVKTLSEFLEISFDPRMLDTSNFWSFAGDPDGHPWTHNSHQTTRGSGIYQTSLNAWQKSLSQGIKDTIDFICESELSLFGYGPRGYSDHSLPTADSLSFIANDSTQCQGWRTDFGNAERDIGSVMFWRVVLSDSPVNFENEMIERCFLFQETYLALRNNEIRSQHVSATSFVSDK